MKKKLILFAIVLLIVGTFVFKLYKDAVEVIQHPIIASDNSVVIKVKNGDNLNKLITRLNNEKKLGNSYLIKWYIKKQNLDTNIKPGDYEIPKEVSLENFIKTLSAGKYNEKAIKVTIPEGFTIEQIAALLQEKEVISKDEFIKSVKEYNPPSYVKIDSNRKYSLEGFLFPDTYEFIKGMKGNEIIEKMNSNFGLVIKDVEKKSGKELKSEDIDNLITMASIVEKEAEKGTERPTVASVFYNRLKIKMQLQSCATVEYALGVHKTVYTYEDLAVKSPYNTYIEKALPVGPVCNPGKDSILAAVSPATSDYLYFVSKFDGSGTHFFTKKYNEFLNFKKISDNNLAKNN
jgi:UPF0755 protein